jgi:hypothetical protein
MTKKTWLIREEKSSRFCNIIKASSVYGLKFPKLYHVLILNVLFSISIFGTSFVDQKLLTVKDKDPEI